MMAPPAPLLAVVLLSSSWGQKPTRPVQHISSIRQLYALQSLSRQHVVMAPGVYAINLTSAADFGGTWPGASSTCSCRPIKCAALFNFSGSDNVWDLRGCKIEFDTKVLGAYRCLHGPHGLGSLLGGDRNVWRGLTWRDVAPLDGSLDYGGFFPGSGTTFVLQGSGHIIDEVSISLRGSGSYGFGALFGKGKNNAMPGVDKSKRAVLGIEGCADTVIRNSVLDNSAFGHLIHIHDRPSAESPLPHTQNLTIANCTMRGEVRTTDDLLRNGVGEVDRHGVPFRITYNGTLYAGGPAGAVTGAVGQSAFAHVFAQSLDRTDKCPGPIAAGKAIALTENGYRFYSNVGMVRFINCTATQTRGGLALGSGIGGAIADRITVRSTAPHGFAACAVGASGGALQPELGESYQPPSHARLTRCAGDATYLPLLTIQPSQAHQVVTNVSADVELLAPEDGREYSRTYNSLAIVTGTSHVLRLWGSGGASAASAGLKIYVGYDVSAGQEAARYSASDITLCNLLPVPVVLGNRSRNVRCWSVGNVIDKGRGNKVVSLIGGRQRPPECDPLAPSP